LKLYTKTGDDGTTGLYGGNRAPKTAARIRSIGEIDELNAALGVARLHSGGHLLDPALAKLQNWLFDLGAELACPPGGKFKLEQIGGEHAQFLEFSMDNQTASLPELKEFILPGGSALAAYLHLARCVCRRAERTILELHDVEPVRLEVRVFVNRLSDWLFVSARTANHSQNVHDIAWRHSEAL